jgi:hypothetical protein
MVESYGPRNGIVCYRNHTNLWSNFDLHLDRDKLFRRKMCWVSMVFWGLWVKVYSWFHTHINCGSLAFFNNLRFVFVKKRCWLGPIIYSCANRPTNRTRIPYNPSYPCTSPLVILKIIFIKPNIHPIYIYTYYIYIYILKKKTSASVNSGHLTSASRSETPAWHSATVVLTVSQVAHGG